MNIFDKADKFQLQALNRLRTETHLLQLFNNVLDDLKSRLVTADNADHIKRLQGQAGTVTDLLAAIEGSTAILERLENTSRISAHQTKRDAHQ